MNYVRALNWAQVGNGLQAGVLVDFATDLSWQIAFGGSINSDYYEALSVDIDGSQLTAGLSMTVTFNQVTVNVPAGSFKTYALAPYQRYLTITNTVAAPNKAQLTFYPYARPEWR